MNIVVKHEHPTAYYAKEELMNWFSHNEGKFAQFFDFYVFTRRLNSVRYRAKDYAENLATKIQK